MSGSANARARPSGEDLLALVEAGVQRAKARGVAEVEVYASYESAARVEFRGRLGEVQETAEGGVCVRVAVGKQQGFAGMPGIHAKSIDLALERALENARHAPADPRFLHHPEPQPITRGPTRIDPRVAQPEADRLLGDAKAGADAVADQPDVTYVTFQLSATCVTFAVANARGVATWDQDARESFLSEMRVSGGTRHKTANEFGVERRPLSSRYDLGELLRGAASRARGALDAKPLDRPVDTVVLDFAPTMLLMIPVLEQLATARARKEGLAEKLGQAFASPAITLRDDPHREDGVRCQRVDDEGTPTRPMTVIDKGVLHELPTHGYFAHQAGEKSAGHGLRGFENRWAGTPRPRLAALDLEAGSKSVDELLAGVDRAVYVRDFLLGHFTSNQVTGDFSTVAPLAFLVEKGSIVQPLPPTTLAGNAFKLFRDIDAVSRERRSMVRGTFPSVRATGLTCAT